MGLDQFDFQAIDLAVRMTGQSAVQDMQAQLGRVKGEINNFSQALAAGVIPATEFTEKVKGLIEQERLLEQSVLSAQRVLNGQSAAMASTQAAAYGAQRATLEMSRAFEDFATGGFLGVLNNIPGSVGGIAQAAGLAAPAVAKVEAAASLLATTGYLVWKNWKDVRALFDDGLGTKTLDDIKDVEKALKDLTEKEWKTRIDVRDMQVAKDQLDELNRAKKGYEGLNAQSEADKRRGEAVTGAVVEGGGRAAVTRAVLAAAVGPESPEAKAAREKMEAYNRRVSDLQSQGLVVPTALEQEIEGFKRSTEGRAALADQNRRTAVERQLGLAGSGDPLQTKWLQDLFAANQDKFQAAGVDVDRFGGGLAAASPDRLFEKEQKKLRAERERDEKQAADKAADVLARASNQMTGYMDEGAKQLEREGNKAADDMARLKDKQDTDARRIRGEATRDGLRRFGPGVEDELQRTMLGHLGQGATADQSTARLLPQLKQRLAKDGAPAAWVNEIAAAILAKAGDKVRNDIGESIGADGGNVPQAARRLRSVADLKIRQRGDRVQGGFNKEADADTQAEIGEQFQVPPAVAKQIANLADQGLGLDAAAQQVFRQMNAHARQAMTSTLKIQAGMEMMAGFMGPATMQLRMLDARQDMLNARINSHATQFGRHQQQRKSLGRTN